MYRTTLLSLAALLIVALTPYAQSTATYDITFTSIWNATDHTSVPGNAHWSKLVGATHKTADTFFKLGELVSPGIKNVAETGNNTVFNSEVDEQITLNEANQYINGPSLGTATGDMLISNLEVSENFPLITLISMIAPSPDWVIAMNGFNLLDVDGNWKTSVTMDMFAYDAGTDDGTDYTSGDIVSDPVQPMSMINSAPTNGNKMGTLSITLTNVTDIKASINNGNIKVFPNPVSNGQITIDNIEGLELTSIELYNNVGSLVGTQLINQSTKVNMNIMQFPDGIYFLRLRSKNKQSITRKLVIQ